MKVIYVKKENQEDYEQFVKANSLDGGLLQSWVWGEFQESIGMKVHRIVIQDDDNEIIASAQIIEKSFPLGMTSFYIPRGPILALRQAQGDIKEALGLLFKEMNALAKKRKCVYLQLDPAWNSFHDREKLLTGLCEKTNSMIQPIHTLIVPLDADHKELIGRMHAKTRYNIGLAMRKGIEVKQVNTVDTFYKLVSKTKERQAIGIHSKKYYQKMLEVLGKDNATIFLAQLQGNDLAAILVAFYNDRAYYLHGGFDFAYRNLQAPVLTQWEAMKETVDRGMKFYDLYGVAPEKVRVSEEEKLRGVTRFKKGFAPDTEITGYIGVYRKVYKKFWFFVYQMIRGR